MLPFADKLRDCGYGQFRAAALDTLQVNLGKVCNQVCRHCHVDAGPHRTESMSRETIERLLEILRRHPIPTVDITGGAPELNPHFEYFVERVRALGRHVIDRCNLTILFEPGKEHLAQFLKDQRVEIIASLPYFLGDNVDRQRGKGVFDRSIAALQLLNRLGYGVEDGLLLNLIYNPTGAYLPPEQGALEREFKAELERRHGVRFNRLYVITNMPISRFLEFLRRSNNYEQYMQRLIQAFNHAAVPNVMCRSLLSIGWDGQIYDCDFNQMLEMPVNHGMPRHIAHFDFEALLNREICVGDHCYGCTAGAGSSCGGSVA